MFFFLNIPAPTEISTLPLHAPLPFLAGPAAAPRHATAHGLGMNLGGGTHHAGRDFARGYCLFNDVALAVALLRDEGLIRRGGGLGCGVPQGGGTGPPLRAGPAPVPPSLHPARHTPTQALPSDPDPGLPS